MDKFLRRPTPRDAWLCSDAQHPCCGPEEKAADGRDLGKSKTACAMQAFQAAADEMVEPFEEKLEALLQGGDEEGRAAEARTAEDRDDDVGSDVAFEGGRASRLLVQLGKATPENVLVLLCELDRHLWMAAPRITHKGVANRRTILERLAVSSRKVVEGASAWGFDACVYIPRLRSFARLVTPFKKEYGAYMVMETPPDEDKRIREMARVSNTDVRFNVEAVVPSMRYAHGGATAWSFAAPRGGAPRVQNVVSSDVYVLPGVNLYPADFPAAGGQDVPSGELVFVNMAAALAAEVEQRGVADWTDTRRVGSIVALIGFMMGDELLSRTNMAAVQHCGLAEPLRALQQCGQAEIENSVGALMEKLTAARARSGKGVFI